MKELNSIIAKVKTGRCNYLVCETDQIDVKAPPGNPELCQMEFEVTGGGTSYYCTCKDNLEAHGVFDKERIELPLFTMRGIMCCLECRFHSGNTTSSQEEHSC